MEEPSPQERIAQLEKEVSELKAKNHELQDSSPAKPPKPGAWRRVLSAIILVLGLVVLVPAGMLLWLDRTVAQPESYIASVGPVIAKPEVQAAIKKSATEAIFKQVDVDKIVSDALPERAQFLSGSITQQVETYTASTISTIVASEQFAKVWVEANVKAQAAFMKVAENGSGDPNIDLNDVYGFITEKLKDTQLAGLAERELPANVGSIQVANVPALERIPYFVATLDAWRWALLALVAVLLAAAVWLSMNRRRTFVWVGWGVIAATIVTLVIVRVIRAMMLDPISDTTYREAAVAVWQTVLNPFLIQILVMAVLGLAIVLTGWLLGPGRAAVGFRRTTQRWLASSRAAIFPTADQSAAVRFTRRHHRALQWGLVGLTLVMMGVSVPLTIASVFTILAIALVLLVLLEFMAAPPLPTHKPA